MSESVENVVDGKSTETTFDSNDYIAKILEFMNSDDTDSNEKFTEFVSQTWSRTDGPFYSSPFLLDSGGISKVPPNMMAAGKRIAGTQRLMYAPPTTMKKTSELEKAGTSGLRKIKKQVPVIDDSIYCTTDQPCSTCNSVSLAGNQVLACKRCRDCYHMKCTQPPISVEEASNPNFTFYCRTCMISKKHIEASRSRSPSPAMLDGKKFKMGKDKPMKS